MHPMHPSGLPSVEVFYVRSLFVNLGTSSSFVLLNQKRNVNGLVE